MKSLTYVELDLGYCANTYGVSPCTAAIPTTGTRKCFNSKKTCQDRAHYSDSTVTLRFAKPTAYLPSDIECIPNIVGVTFTPAIISLGENLGQRATLEITFSDHRHSDTGAGFDKYLSDRGYDPFKQGTFWGKFRARHPFVRGRALRLLRGFVGQSLAQMEVHNFVVDSFDGPDQDGSFKLIAKDVLKLADDDRSQAPKLSNGYLLSDITSSSTSFTATPSGVGSQYPSSGYVALGGKEIVSFTRSGDAFTITRGQFNTSAQAHKAESRVQLCLRYAGQDPANIIYDLLVNYAGVPSGYINLTNWTNETGTYLQRVYTALIAEPTGVNQLVSELIEQAALAVWWDTVGQLLKLQVLRSIPIDAAVFDNTNTMRGSMTIREQPEKRISQVWTYYAQRDPLQPLDNEDNFKSTLLTTDPTAESDYGSSAIKKIYSRWIPEFGRTVANHANAITLGRFRDPPRAFSFDVFRSQGQTAVQMGGGYQIGSHSIQDDTGALDLAPAQITRLKPDADRWSVEAEEMLFTDFDVVDLNNRVITIDANTYNFNLRTVHDTLFPTITSIVGLTITCIINAGVHVGSTSTGSPAFNVGSWPTGLPVTIINNGRIQGMGGGGGYGNANGHGAAGSPGGPALYTRFPITMQNASGQVWGGGGGGGGAAGAGGGGAGDLPGAGNFNVYFPSSSVYFSNAGTTEAGGTGGAQSGGSGGGNGGGPGLAGNAGGSPDFPAGGAAGNAIDGRSYITFSGSGGDRRGSEVN